MEMRIGIARSREPFSEEQFHELEQLAFNDMATLSREEFRLHLIHIVDFLHIRRADRQSAKGKFWHKLADDFDSKADALYVTAEISKGTDTERLVAFQGQHYRNAAAYLRRKPADAKSREDVRHAVAALLDLCASGTGQTTENLSPGAREFPNRTCIFVRKVLCILGDEYGTDAIFKYVNEVLSARKAPQ